MVENGTMSRPPGNQAGSGPEGEKEPSFGLSFVGVDWELLAGSDDSDSPSDPEPDEQAVRAGHPRPGLFDVDRHDQPAESTFGSQADCRGSGRAAAGSMAADRISVADVGEAMLAATSSGILRKAPSVPRAEREPRAELADHGATAKLGRELFDRGLLGREPLGRELHPEPADPEVEAEEPPLEVESALVARDTVADPEQRVQLVVVDDLWPAPGGLEVGSPVAGRHPHLRRRGERRAMWGAWSCWRWPERLPAESS